MGTDSRVGSKIREIMHKKDISQIQLAAMTGISEGHLSRIMQGRVDFGVSKLEKLAEALGVPVSSFWDDDKASKALFYSAYKSLPEELVTALGDARKREWLLLGLSMKDKKLTKEEIELILAAYAHAKEAIARESEGL